MYASSSPLSFHPCTLPLLSFSPWYSCGVIPSYLPCDAFIPPFIIRLRLEETTNTSPTPPRRPKFVAVARSIVPLRVPLPCLGLSFTAFTMYDHQSCFLEWVQVCSVFDTRELRPSPGKHDREANNNAGISFPLIASLSIIPLSLHRLLQR